MIEIHPVTSVMYPALLPPGQDTVPNVVPAEELIVYDERGHGVRLAGRVNEPHAVFVGNEAILLIEP